MPLEAWVARSEALSARVLARKPCHQIQSDVRNLSKPTWQSIRVPPPTDQRISLCFDKSFAEPYGYIDVCLPQTLEAVSLPQRTFSLEEHSHTQTITLRYCTQVCLRFLGIIFLSSLDMPQHKSTSTQKCYSSKYVRLAFLLA